MKLAIQLQFILWITLAYGMMITNTTASLMNKLAELCDYELTSTIIGLQAVACYIGACVSNYLLPIIGRHMKLENMFIMFLIINIISNALLMIPVHWVYWFIVRIFNGFATGGYFGLIPIFVNLYSPNEKRKSMMQYFSIINNSGVFLGYVADFIASLTDFSFWYIYYILPLVFSLIGLIIAFVMKYKGEWMFRQATWGELVQPEQQVDDIQQKVESQREFKNSQEAIKQYTWKQRSIMVVQSITLGIAQMTTGILNFLTFASVLLSNSLGGESVKYSGIYASLITGFLNAIFVVIALPMVEKIGRKPLLIIGFLGTAICDFIISANLKTVNIGNLTLAITILFLFFYQISPGPLVLALCSELFPEDVKMHYNMYGFVLNWACSILTNYVYPYFTGFEWILLLVYGCLTVMFTLIIIFIFPETKDKTSDQVKEELLQKWK